ncbi:hypothetical protein M3Y99_01087500 [Aphelenchoides fujianensis]|nr:hypothetical protein M3Y99_01087500 [Aphelenchoides fujianensis]
MIVHFLLPLLFFVDCSAVCTWPKTDVLFALDSTSNVDTTANHRRLVEFARHMRWGPDGNQVAVAQFTPQAKYEFGFVSNNAEALDRQLNTIPFVPCQGRPQQCAQDMASMNTLVRGALSADEGNRVLVPDVLVVISTSLYQPRVVNPGELLVRPLSPTHVFLITIGNGAPSARYTHTVHFGATTTHLAALDFNALVDLEVPLCESVNSFLGDEQVRTSGFLKPSLCILIIALTAVIAVLVVLCLSYAIFRFRNDNRRLSSQLRAEQENLRKQEEYFNGKLRERSANVKEREKTMMDLINESQRIREHYRDQTMPLPVTVVNNDDEITLNDQTLFDIERSHSHLPPEHPARVLPPIDLLLLVDASSSIGINSYESVKQVLREFVQDIDIGPGRSRVAAIVFANEPQVYFGFDRFYSVRKCEDRHPPNALPGRADLSWRKLFTFSAGVFYQEQNMKEVTHRNRTMPTPRHDRPQIMLVVSDGISDDNFDRQATHLHERMLVRVAALVTKSFNKERLVPITRFDGAIFTLNQREALSIWLWRTQRLWNENYAGYVEREKSFNQTTGRRTNRN